MLINVARTANIDAVGECLKGPRKKMPESILKIGMRIVYAILMIVPFLWLADWFGMFDAILPKSITELTWIDRANIIRVNYVSIETKGRNLRSWEIKGINSLSLRSPGVDDIDFLKKIPNLTSLTIIKDINNPRTLEIACRNGEGLFFLEGGVTVEVGELSQVSVLRVDGYDISRWKLDSTFPNLHFLIAENWIVRDGCEINVEFISSKVKSISLANCEINANLMIGGGRFQNVDIDESIIKTATIYGDGWYNIVFNMSIVDELILDSVTMAGYTWARPRIDRSIIKKLNILPSDDYVGVGIVDSYVPSEFIDKAKDLDKLSSRFSYQEGCEEYFQNAECALALLSTLPDWPKPKIDGWSHIIQSATQEEGGLDPYIIPAATN